MTDKPVLPLDGIRILDFTQVMLGPCATQMLGDFGADIIKIERPGAGDLSRNFFGEISEEAQNNAVYSSLNRNKRSMTIDTKSEAGKQIVYDLVKHSDVVVNNFRAGVMDRLGFGYETLKEINPRIIFASGTGFGSTGPYAHKGGQDVLAQAMSGVMEKTSDPSIPQSIYPTTLCDYSAGMHLVQGVLAALLAREKTGVGQKVDVSLYELDDRHADAGSGAMEQASRGSELGRHAADRRFRDNRWRACGCRGLQGESASRYLHGARDRGYFRRIS